MLKGISMSQLYAGLPGLFGQQVNGALDCAGIYEV